MLLRLKEPRVTVFDLYLPIIAYWALKRGFSRARPKPAVVRKAGLLSWLRRWLSFRW